ncbi:hypothetical protein HMPREF9093_00791 [Fusobacterium sp. oral taxon 370 str. F0437]|uniref:prohibitin family protein n=1 Tax=Fusobacterium sp. oral taxon 370 TaxID=712288 RepID=UPI000234A3CA|nr:prohibitin family protein [Fusobacterium sp. oral taxon 370]EHI78948.1 hypothetical protein HMPREF9093_00791 [Fusobacterium sp. oral taxon 370 str. F0437]
MFEGKKYFKMVLSGAIGVFILLLILTNCYTVDTGEVVIISTFGKITRVENEGLHFKIPFVQGKTFMETREKTYIFGRTDEMDTTMEVSTKDMQSIKLEFTVQSSITDPEKLYRAFNNKHEQRFIRPRVKEIIQATIAKYTIEEFVSKRADYFDVKEFAADYAYTMDGGPIGELEYERAIESKKVAEQEVEKARAEQEKLKVEAENKVRLAEYSLQEKELQAKANAVESNSLTPQLLRKMAIEKWDGKLPQVQGNNGSTLINLD